MRYQPQQRNKKEGFTLIEIIVSVALFSVVMTISVGALFMIINANREAKAIKLVVNNLNISMEAITRELRVGYNYCSFDYSGSYPDDSSVCNDTSTGGSNDIYYTNDSGVTRSAFRKNPSTGAIERRTGNNPWLQLTGNDVTVDDLSFYISGTRSGGPAPALQPSVVITMRGTIQVGSQDEDFQIQSTVTQRRLAP